MSGHLSTADKIEILEIFSRYCHAVDHGDGDGWAGLFTLDGVFEVVGAVRLEGTAQLGSMPAGVTEQGGGKWRHQVTSVVSDPGPEPGTAMVKAYGLVTDWRDGGKVAIFTDYEITLRRVGDAWRIATLNARMP
jgi:hypothetical protein